MSRSLNDSDLVNYDTKQRIKELARSLGFQYHQGAQTLKTRKSKLIALFYPENFDEYRNLYFTGPYLMDIRRRMDTMGYDYLPVHGKRDLKTGNSNLIRLAGQRRVDGFLLMDSDISHDEWAYLRDNDIPFVQLHYHAANYPMSQASYITVDNYQGGILGARRVIDQGANRLACLTITSRHKEILDRVRGFHDEAESRGISRKNRLVLDSECSFWDGKRLVQENWQALQKVDAIVCHSDVMALGAIKALAEQGVRTGQDMLVIGYDNIEMGTYFSPTLTTVHQPWEEVSEKACVQLISMVEKIKSPLLQVVCQPTLVLRESA